MGLPIALMSVVGCYHPRIAPPADKGGVGRWLPADQPKELAPQPMSNENESLSPASANLPRRPQHILALSGGGMYGAYTAGVLNGWTKSGKRPTFDVVTGISTGALIGALAFLGPEYDGQMEQFYTTIRRRDIFTYRSWATVPFRDAVANTAPLRKILDTAITDEIVVAMAKAHKDGRRLYVGTTNLDTRRFVTWDIGAIACRPDVRASRKLIATILVASCSLPGVFPPQPIEVVVNGKKFTELHVDGGVVAPMFLPPSVFDAAVADPNKAATLQTPAQLYVIQAAKSYADGSPVESKILPVLGASAASIMMAQYRREVSNMYHMARVAGVDFRMLALSAEFPTPSNGLDFDRKEMNKLFDEGYRIASGTQGPSWWNSPPERGAGESDPVRTGNRFRAERYPK